MDLKNVQMLSGMARRLMARRKLGLFLSPVLSVIVALAAFAALPALSDTGSLNDTGITACADATSSNVDCASAASTFFRQDGNMGRDAQYAGQPTKPFGGGGNAGFDFTKIANNGNVLPESAALGSGPSDWACTRDNVTGLIWEVKTNFGLRNQSHTYKWYQNGQGAASKVTDSATCEMGGRCDTEKFVSDVNAAGLCGSTPGSGDWRMPTIKELENIVDFGRINPTIDTTYFPYTNVGNYWSGTVNSSYANAQFAWFVEFLAGKAIQNQTSVPQSVRLVRGTPATATYALGTDVSGKTVSALVTDSRTGLMWKSTHELNGPIQTDDWRTLVHTFSWQQALERAKLDTTGGYSDWRLPNIKELRSLVDETFHDPAINPIFTSPPFQAWFWSSSIYTDSGGNQNYSLVVSSDQGSNQYSPRSFIHHVRLVRGGDSFDKFGGAVSLSPAALEFGTQGVFSTSSAKTITITNTGSGVLTITGITFSGTDYKQSNNCNTLAAGLSCSISVTFTPSATGARPGAIMIGSNAAGSPHTVSLGGTGKVDPGLSLSSGAVDFGAQNLNTSATQTVTVSNTGTDPIDIASIFATGTDYTQTNICRALTTGSSCTISVTFAPTAVGIRTGAITIASNAAGSPHSLSLTGSGLAAVQYALSVTPLGTGTGIVTSSPAGINCGALCSAVYADGTSVTLTAIAATGSTFSGWGGAGCSGTGNCTVNVNQAQNVTATFTASGSAEYALTITPLGTGTGTVTSSPAGINCGALCSAVYVSGTSVTLTASPDSNSTFAGWSGAGCSGAGSCTVAVNQAQNVTASFTASGSGSYTLTVAKTGTGTGTVTSISAGINCGALCSAVYGNGTSVTLTASPSSGSTFAGWSGAGCAGVGTCTVTVNQTQNVTATFTSSGNSGGSYTLTVTRLGTGNGTVVSSQTGINCGALCSAVYSNGTSVTLTATAATGSTFAGWSGAGCSGAGICTLTVNQAQNITATFTAISTVSYTLTVAKTGTGTGTVASIAVGINCGALCSAVYTSGTSVTLTASPSAGSTFTGWAGAGCSGTLTCVMTMSQVRNVTATFTLNPNTITVTKAGTGLGTVFSPAGSGLYCGTVCSLSVPSGTSVTLTATPNTGYTFGGWSGDCSGTAVTCTVSMSQVRNVTATFTLNPNTITVTKAGTGLGTVSSPAGSGLYCGTVCSVSYPSGTSVTLTATATTGSTFTGWTGDCSAAGTSCTVSMNQVRNVTATFNLNPNTITVTKAGTGLGTVSSPAGSGLYCGTVCSVSYPSGTSVTLTATATTGSTFAGWSDAGCSGLTCTVVMNKAQNVTATFAPSRYALVVARSGNGSGTVVSTPTGVNCGAPCIVYFDSGTSVTLTATAAQGSTFAGWSGASCSGIATCTVTVNQTKDVTANFTASSLGGGVVPGPTLQPAGLYDGIYQWDAGYYLSVHQKGDGTLIGSIYWAYTANTEQVGARTIPEADTFDLLQGQIAGTSATMSGTRFYRACTLSYDLTFNANSTLTVRLNSVSNSPGVSATDINCAARYNAVGSTWTIPRIY